MEQLLDYAGRMPRMFVRIRFPDLFVEFLQCRQIFEFGFSPEFKIRSYRVQKKVKIKKHETCAHLRHNERAEERVKTQKRFLWAKLGFTNRRRPGFRPD